MSRRVVITGIGLVSPLGIGTSDNWDALLAGKSGIGTVTKFDATGFPARIAGEVKGFKPEDWMDEKEARAWRPRVVFVDGRNHPRELRDERGGQAKLRRAFG